MVRYVTSPSYAVDIGAHVFPTTKYAAIVNRLRTEDGVASDQVLEPEPAEPDEVLRVHDADYFARCRSGRLTTAEILRLELPWSAALYDASLRCAQGSITAVRLALEHGVGLHVGGGFHHAYPDHGEGFCVFNDHAIALRHAQSCLGLGRAAVVDTDVHHGNGTAAVFAGDATVGTYSIHQDGIYPHDRPASTVDVGLPAGTPDERYLGRLEETLIPFLERIEPELVAYVAGADPYRQDQLGGLALTVDGLRRRDRLVIDACAAHDIPVFVVLAGGYAWRLEDTVEIHLGTIREARRLWRDDSEPQPALTP